MRSKEFEIALRTCERLRAAFPALTMSLDPDPEHVDFGLARVTRTTPAGCASTAFRGIGLGRASRPRLPQRDREGVPAKRRGGMRDAHDDHEHYDHDVVVRVPDLRVEL